MFCNLFFIYCMLCSMSMIFCLFFFFFFKQKTAYEMRISDWSSDVCSSDLFFYGGSWNRGDKSEYEFVGRRLASMGYITAVPNYRLYPEEIGRASCRERVCQYV